MYKHHFGKSDSAVYLAEYLMKKGNEYEMRKVSSKFVAFFRQVKELAFSSLSPELKVWALNHLQDDFVSSDQKFTDDELIYDLMRNVARGKIRETFRALKEDDPEGYKRVVPSIAEYEPKGYPAAA
jgi:hypothetical protein